MAESDIRFALHYFVPVLSKTGKNRIVQQYNYCLAFSSTKNRGLIDDRNVPGWRFNVIYIIGEKIRAANGEREKMADVQNEAKTSAQYTYYVPAKTEVCPPYSMSMSR